MEVHPRRWPIPHAAVSQAQTALQFRSSELSLRSQRDMDKVITIITKENKMANKSSKACTILLLSFTNVIFLFLFLKWVEKKIMTRTYQCLVPAKAVKVGAWEAGHTAAQTPQIVSLSCSPLPTAPYPGADPKVWQSLAPLCCSVPQSRGSRLLDHGSPA